MIRSLNVLMVVVIFCCVCVAGQYEPNWQSLDSREIPQWFDEAKFGIFIHWGVYAVPSWAPKGSYAEWYGYAMHQKDSPTAKFHSEEYGDTFDYKEFAADFTAQLFDADKWAELFKRSGAKYVVLTSKHHDGFCLWPSEQSPGWNSLDVGPKIDIAGTLAAAVRKQGLKMGFYYSLYEWHNPLYKTDVAKYVPRHMLAQLTELVQKYEPALIFADGEWDHNSDVWLSEKFLAWLYNDSAVKDYVVVNDRWGKDCRSRHGGYYTSEYGQVDLEGTKLGSGRKWEESRGMGGSYGYNRNEDFADYQTTKQLIDMFVKIVSNGGNLLLNIGPTADGLIPVIMQERLIEMGDWLKINGLAIYGTRPYKITSQGENIFFTANKDDLFVILTAWPDKSVELKDIPVKEGAVINLLGTDIDLKWQLKDGVVTVDTSVITPGLLPSGYANVLRVTDFMKDSN